MTSFLYFIFLQKQLRKHELKYLIAYGGKYDFYDVYKLKVSRISKTVWFK